MSGEPTYIAIDCGTTNSRVAVVIDDQVKVIENDPNRSLSVLSTVTFTDNGILVGKTDNLSNPENRVSSIKRFIGCQGTLEADKTNMPFTVTHQGMNEKKTMIGIVNRNEKKIYFPEEILAHILRKMKLAAQSELKKQVGQAVITVPASFNDAQRRAIRDAGLIAGFENVRLLNEPSAAAIAFASQIKDASKKNLLVFCLGGGSFDAAVISISGNGVVTVKATVGDSHLGGLSFEMKMAEYVKEESKNQETPLIISDEELRILKERLSTKTEVRTGTQKNPGFKLTRNTFERMNKGLFISTLDYVDTVLEAADIDSSDIDDVIVVGGSCRIPFMLQILDEFFGRDRLRLMDEEAVVRGAAIYASAIQKGTSSNILIDVSASSVGISIPQRLTTLTMLEKNERLCTDHFLRFIPLHEDDETLLTVLEGGNVDPLSNKIIGTIKLRHTQLARSQGYRLKFTTDLSGLVDFNVGIYTGKAGSKDKPTDSEAVAAVGENVEICYLDGRMSDEEIQASLSMM